MCAANKKYALLLVMSFLFLFVAPAAAAPVPVEEKEPLEAMQEKLTAVAEEEKKVLEDLFNLVQEIENMDREEKAITRDLEVIQDDIKTLESKIQTEQKNYDQKKDVLRDVLITYQKRGAGTFLDIVLQSESLSDFLDRLNILRDLTRNTDELLDALEESKQKLAEEKARLDEKFAQLSKKQEDLKQAIAAKSQKRQEMEYYLASLQEEKQYYEEQLERLQTVWEDLKQLFPRVTEQFSSILMEGSLPPDTITVTFSFFRVTGTLKEEALNKVIQDYTELPEMVFHFKPGQTEIHIPEKHFILTGNLEIKDDTTLQFIPAEGSFYELPLTQASLEELFRSGGLEFPLGSVLGQSRIESAESKEGFLELIILPLFY
jgi:peptidoglycan hydrolase CwlO-like protein